MSYTLFHLDGRILFEDAEQAVVGYDAMTQDCDDPVALWRTGGGRPECIIHITTCKECGEPVLMSHTDVSNWVGAFGELEDVLCVPCLDKMLDREEAAYQEMDSWEQEVERLQYNGLRIDQ